MAEFIKGAKDKYPEQLLRGRLECEGNVISCLMTDLLLLDETNFTDKDFISADGLFLFNLMKALRKKGFYSLDDVTILSNSSERVLEQYEQIGGWDTIQHQIDIINVSNFEIYADILNRENILLKLHNDGFDLLKTIQVNDKDITLLKMFRKMTSDEVEDWITTRIGAYSNGYSKKVLEEGNIEFDDKFLSDLQEGELNGVPFDYAGIDVNGNDINTFTFLSRQTNGFQEGTLNILGGFSGAGKSTFYIGIIMSLVARGKKVLIVSNEEKKQAFQIRFLVWLVTNRNRYYKLTKKKLMSGDIDEEGIRQLEDAKSYWNEHYKDKIAFVGTSDMDMTIVKKKIREYALRKAYDVFLVDTMKLQANDFGKNRTDLTLVEDSRELHTIAQSYGMIGFVSFQLLESMKGTLFLNYRVREM